MSAHASAGPPAPAPADTLASQPRPATGVRRRSPRTAWPPSPPIGRDELSIVALLAIALAIVTSWPLAIHLPSRIAPDLGDPVRTAWQVAWLGHALLTDPLHLWNSNAFWPRSNSLAFSDSLLGYAPIGAIGSGTTAALVRYNLLFLFAYALAFVGPYLLTRELGARRGGSAVAAAAFAYAPFRADEAGHLHVISSGGIALALFLLLRGYRSGSRPTIAAGWVVAAWQISLGFTLGLQFVYLLAVLLALCVVQWWRRGRPQLPRPLFAVSLAGLALLAAVTVYEARPYIKVSHDYPTARRTLAEVKRYSAGPAAFIAAPQPNRVWGAVTKPQRERLSSQNESALFPGALTVGLALMGLATPLYTRRLRIGLLAGALLCAVFALGLGLGGAGYPYRLLYDYAPGWDGVRVPARLMTLTTLALALLAGAGAQRLIGAAIAACPASPSLRRAMALGVGALLAAAVVFEGAGKLAHPRVPAVPAGQVGLRGPLLGLPTDPGRDRIYQYWSVDGFPKIANGNSTFDIPSLDSLRGGMQNFPDRPGVERLRRLGVRTVVLHTEPIGGLPPDSFASPEPPDPRLAARRSIAGLGITRRRVGSLVIFEILGARR